MKKTIGLMALMAMITVLMTGTVYALGVGCTITDIDYMTPDTFIYVDVDWGTEAINTSIGKANITITGCTTFYMQNATTVNNTNGTFNFTVSAFEIADWKDDIQCSAVAQLWNWSAAGIYESVATCDTETFYPDHTVPECTHSQSSRETYNPKQTWEVIGMNASSATIQFGANAVRGMTENSDVFTWTGKLPESTYDPVRAITSDGLNETTCDLRYVRIDTESTIRQVGLAIAASEEGQKAGTTGNSTAIIAVIVILGIWYIRKRN